MLTAVPTQINGAYMRRLHYRRLRHGAAQALRNFALDALAPEQSGVGAWLTVYGPILARVPPDPGFPPGSGPIPNAAALREGALLYEVDGGPCARSLAG